jgi:arabinose-5-phosphate isomerase
MTEFSNDKILHLARDVFKAEAEAVANLSGIVSDDFVNAAKLVHSNGGRLIVCGMGKSGHIGTKIAATLASTGTPSFFMHPGEAYHGDLGMLVDNDIIMLISNSGETDEIIKLIPPLKRRAIPIISITSKPDSTLAKNSDYHLNIDVQKEACPHGLAPTTSTTASLAMGDALAVVLMTMKGFEPENFAMFHPGGSLGRKLLTKVRDVMRDSALPIVSLASDFTEIVNVMTKGMLGICIVMENDELKGVITDGDLRRALLASDKSRFDFRANEIMSSNPKAVDAEDNISEVEEIMMKSKIKELIVTENSKVVGVIQLYSFSDI